MILSKFINIIIQTANYKRLLENGYKNLKVGDNIIISISILSKNSHQKIKVKCDICGKERELSYSKYNKNISKYNIYTCSQKCAQIKNKKTNLERYGFENVFQNEEIKEKSKKTLLKKYSVEHPILNNDIKEKTKKTNLERYGFENVFQNEEIKEKSKKTNLERYGFEYSFKNLEIQKKYINTILEKYGVEYPTQSEEIREKVIKTNLKKYGVENYIQSTKYKEYMINQGFWKSEKELTLFRKYRNKISILTKHNKNKLFENWDGYDYYDGEYIKDNLKFNSSEKDYPTIDHKISVYYAYINNLEVEKIADISNLCITKRVNNSKKSTKCDFDFKIPTNK